MVKKYVQEKLLYPIRMVHDFVITPLGSSEVNLLRRQFDSVQRTVARQGLALLLRITIAAFFAFGILLPAGRRKQGGQGYQIVIVEVFITQTKPQCPLTNQGFYGMLNELLITIIRKTTGETGTQVKTKINLTKKQYAPIGTDMTAIDRFCSTVSPILPQTLLFQDRRRVVCRLDVSSR